MRHGTLETGMDVSSFPVEQRGLDEARVPARRAVGWLRAARVSHWAHFLVLPVGGLDPRLDAVASAITLARGVAIAFAVLAFGYLLNGIADRHMDHGAEKNPLAASEPAAQHYRVLYALAIVALALALTGPLVVVVATLASLASGIVYSVGPRLKRVALVGTLLNATNFAPLLWVGVGDVPVAGLIPLTLAFSCLLLQNQLLHEAADQDEDRRGELRTSVLVLGARGASVVALFFGVGLAITAGSWSSLSALAWPLAAIYGLAFPLALALGGATPPAMKKARLVHRLLAIATGALVFASLRL